MLFVIEGTDGTGKTTLADALVKALAQTRHRKIVQRHFGPPQEHPLGEYERWLDFYRPGSGTHVVLDRFHWGEMVYSELYRDGSQLGEAGYWHIEQYLRSRGALMIHATGDPDIIASRQLEKREDFLRPEHADFVQARFHNLAATSLQRVMQYDSTDTSIEDAVEEALAEAALREIVTAPLKDFPSYIGGDLPSLLLVGDTPNDEGIDAVARHEAAFVPYPATSGRYLLDSLLSIADENALQWLGITNAYHHDVVPIALRTLWNRLNNPEIVGLGRRAQHHLNVLGLPHRDAPHPQWQRRFKHHEKREYAELVLEGRDG